jgi:hypothetical protein
VRSGGEQRLSDFLLWECAYAELVFSPCLWPDFGVAQLEEAVVEFKKRERRFGLLPSMDNAASDNAASETVTANDDDSHIDASHTAAEAANQPRSAKDAV